MNRRPRARCVCVCVRARAPGGCGQATGEVSPSGAGNLAGDARRAWCAASASASSAAPVPRAGRASYTGHAGCSSVYRIPIPDPFFRGAPPRAAERLVHAAAQAARGHYVARARARPSFSWPRPRHPPGATPRRDRRARGRLSCPTVIASVLSPRQTGHLRPHRGPRRGGARHPAASGRAGAPRPRRLGTAHSVPGAPPPERLPTASARIGGAPAPPPHAARPARSSAPPWRTRARRRRRRDPTSPPAATSPHAGARNRVPAPKDRRPQTSRQSTVAAVDVAAAGRAVVMSATP